MHTTKKVVKKVNRNPKKPIESNLSKQWHSVRELHSNGCITDGKQCLFFSNIKCMSVNTDIWAFYLEMLSPVSVFCIMPSHSSIKDN